MSGDCLRPSGKILTLDRLAELREEARQRGVSVVQCHGCFDIVHPGHVRHLQDARTLGQLLLVTLTGDSEMDKGTGRPLIPEELRAENLAALDCVDWVYINHDPTATKLLDAVRPDVYVKGREYEFNKDPRFQTERETVERHGGRVVFSSGEIVFSSSALIAAMDQAVDPYHKQLAQLVQLDELQPAEVFGRITKLRDKRVLIVGESIVDTYVLCDRPQVADESPVMTLRPLEHRHYDGGAAIIARHVASMGARATLVTPMPDDEPSRAMQRRLEAEGITVIPVPIDVPITEKQRFLVGTQKVMKVDLHQPIVLDSRRQKALVEAVVDAARCDAAIVADFALGLFTPHLLQHLSRSLRPRVGLLVGGVSGKRASLRAMRSCDLVCLSESELRDTYGQFDESLPAVVWKMLDETGSKATLVSMGADGLVAFDGMPDGASWDSRLRAEHVPALSPFAIDALGCGDALMAAATLMLTTGSSLRVAAFMGAAAAAAQAQQIGNLPVSARDLRHGVSRVHASQLTFGTSEVIDARSSRTARSEIELTPGSQLRAS